MTNCLLNLSKISWEFENEKTTEITHGFHPFHGKFIPQIPGVLISELTKEGDIVLDPFCGSGTTLIEANILNRNVIGNDISPIAILMSTVKSTYIDINILEMEKENLLHYLDSNKKKCVIPNFPNKDIWYNNKTLEELGIIWAFILGLENEEVHNFFKLAFSSILKTVANRSKNWNWAFIGDNVLPKIDNYINANKYFLSSLDKMINGMKDFKKLKTSSSINIIKSDTRTLSKRIENNSVKLIVTSPPYCFAVDFNRYYRLSYYWFGWDIDSNKELEIGARAKRARKNSINEYFNDMDLAVSEFYKILNKGGYLCLTLGDTQKKNEIIESVDYTITSAIDKGFKLIDHSYRELSRQSMPQKRIKKESVLIFQK